VFFEKAQNTKGLLSWKKLRVFLQQAPLAKKEQRLRENLYIFYIVFQRKDILLYQAID
jgi:hypothetical protein